MKICRLAHRLNVFSTLHHDLLLLDANIPISSIDKTTVLYAIEKFDESEKIETFTEFHVDRIFYNTILSNCQKRYEYSSLIGI